MKVRFICGCEIDLDLGNDDGLTFDDEGLLICPEHGLRRYGYLSTGRNHKLDGLTPFQLEGHLIFGHPAEHNVGFEIRDVVGPDMRDNRDPSREDIDWLGDLHEIRLLKGAETRDSDYDEVQRVKSAREARERLGLSDKTGWPVHDGRGPHNGAQAPFKGMVR